MKLHTRTAKTGGIKEAGEQALASTHPCTDEMWKEKKSDFLWGVIFWVPLSRFGNSIVPRR